MVIRGGPAPNSYKLPNTVGYKDHDPTKLRDPAYTLRIKHNEESTGLGPGLYNILSTTRFGPSKPPAFTMAAKLPELSNFKAPGPLHYRPEKCNIKPNPPKYTMAKRTPLVVSSQAPGPNTYKLPSTLGPRVPDKHCNGAFTMGLKIKTPRGEGIPGPNKYGPVQTSTYKSASAKYTMGKKSALSSDKTQKPAPNRYYPKLKNKEKQPTISFGKRDSDGRIIYLTLDDLKK